VYRALHTTLKIQVAVKVLLSHGAEGGGDVGLSAAEARLLARLDHPAITRVLDYDDAGPFTFLVLEYVDGLTLRDLILQSGAIRQARALAIAIEVAEGLAFASERGVIHRDVKPANILLTREGRAKVADLGLAKVVGDGADGGDEGLSSIVGTPAYMAPEQALASDEVDLRADIYALGATLYHAVTGRIPFDDADPLEIIRKHIEEPLTAPSDLSGAIEPGVSDMIERMMAKAPADRFPDYASLIAEMRRVQEAIGQSGSSSSKLMMRLGADKAREGGASALGLSPVASRGKAGEPAFSTGAREEVAPASGRRPPPRVDEPVREPARAPAPEAAPAADPGARLFAEAWEVVKERLGGRRAPLALEALPLDPEFQERRGAAGTSILHAARYSVLRADGRIGELRLVAIDGPGEEIVSLRVFPARPDRLPILAAELLALGGEPRLAFIDMQSAGLGTAQGAQASAQGASIARRRRSMRAGLPCPDWALGHSTGGWFYARPDGGGAEVADAIIETLSEYAEAFAEIASQEPEAAEPGAAPASDAALRAYKASHIASGPGTQFLSRVFGAGWTRAFLVGFLYA